MSKNKKPRKDDDDDDAPLGEWVLVTYHCYYSVQLMFVVKVDGKPQANWWPTSACHKAYRWNSYHAARKFQRSNPCLRGYVILNLAEIEKQCEEQRRIDDEDIAISASATPPADE